MFLAILLLVCALSTNSLSEGRTIHVDNGQRWGTWSYLQMCPSGTHAGGFSIRVERDQGGGDDTALNGIKLHCVRGGSHYTTSTVTSNPGYWGDWGDVRWCRGKLVSFQLNIEADQHKGDDTAANDINFKCSNGQIIHGSSGLSWGIWGHFSQECTSGGICGIQTSVERHQGKGDDTGLNDVEFVCCS